LQIMWNSYWKGETRSSESFNGVFSHFRLSDKFYDKSGHLERNVLGQFAITIQVFVFFVKFQILNSPLFCCVCKHHATKAEMVKRSCGECFDDLSSIAMFRASFPWER